MKITPTPPFPVEGRDTEKGHFHIKEIRDEEK